VTSSGSSSAAVATIDVRSDRGNYPVLIGSGLLNRLPGLLESYAPAHRYALISDDRVAGLLSAGVLEDARQAGLDVELFTFPQGEENKTRKRWSILTDALLEWGMGRDGAIIAMGGGVTGDLAGFVASTYLRGVPVVQVPTNLVAMIDASVGGKTGVDVRAGKNLVGAFHPPKVVIADPETTVTLDRSQRAQGLAEAVKHGAILDSSYLRSLHDEADALLAGDPVATRAAVERSVHIKAGVVSRDEEESGLREILNFGHTLGHALEAAAGYTIGHGTGVAAGMLLEARLGERLGVTEPGTAEALEDTLSRFDRGEPLRVEGGADVVRSFLRTDKKARGGRVRFVLLRRIGAVYHDEGWSHEVEGDAVEGLLSQAGLHL
jgi:3-dehydroquinate synthase